MHRFLRSIGFSKYQKRKEIASLLDRMAQNAGGKRQLEIDSEVKLCELRTEVAPGMGIAMVGEINEEGKFERDYYYPYLISKDMSSDVECSIQRHSEKETYAGLLDENRVGISLIFFIDNGFEYMEKTLNKEIYRVGAVNLTGLSVEGKILLPIKKTQAQIDSERGAAVDRNRLMEAAKNGDQDAIETLTIEDIDLYSQISRRMMNEDVYSIVDTTFMPSGIECDQYLVIGEILRMEERVNGITGERVYDLTITCNDMIFHVGINADDLLGEPLPGRRFKGQIWMQGVVRFA